MIFGFIFSGLVGYGLVRLAIVALQIKGSLGSFLINCLGALLTFYLFFYIVLPRMTAAEAQKIKPAVRPSAPGAIQPR